MSEIVEVMDEAKKTYRLVRGVDGRVDFARAFKAVVGVLEKGSAVKVTARGRTISALVDLQQMIERKLGKENINTQIHPETVNVDGVRVSELCVELQAKKTVGERG